MDNNFMKKVGNDTQLEIRNVLGKLLLLRTDGNLKSYRNLTETLSRLISIFENNLETEAYNGVLSSPDKEDIHIKGFRVKINILNFLKCLIVDLETEANSLHDKSSHYLKENDFYNHRDNIISYEKMIILRNKMSSLYNYQIKLHK